MSKLAFAVAVVALTLAGWQALENQSLRKDLRAQQDALAEVKTRLYEREVDRSRRAAASDAPAADQALRTVEPALVGSPDGGLAKQVADLQKRVEDAEKKAESAKVSPDSAFQTAEKIMGGTFYTDVESASKQLKLDEHQKGDLQRIVDATRAELQDLHSLANDDGQTWNEAVKIKFEGNADGAISFATGFEKLERFKQTKIPGSNETFGEADKRIRRNGKDRARNLLTPEQAKTWDKALTDPLFGGAGMGGFAISIATDVDAPDADEKAPAK